MAREPQEIPSVFRIDVGPNASDTAMLNQSKKTDSDMTSLLRQLVVGQQRQTEMLEELIDQIGSGQRQRVMELGQWRDANPVLARRCRSAAEALSQVQVEFLGTMTREINENADALMDGDFMLNEFVDRFGPPAARFQESLLRNLLDAVGRYLHQNGEHRRF